MSKKVLFITDSYESLNLKKDTSILMIDEAIKNKLDVFQCELNDLFIEEDTVFANSSSILSSQSKFIKDTDKKEIKVLDFKYCFMRKDPPVDEDYINALHLLGLAEKQGANVHNKPNSIKEFNEKIFAIHFSKYIPNTLVTSNIKKIHKFFERYENIVIKPLDGMGGKSIFKITEFNNQDIDLINKMTNSGKTQIICQKFIEEIFDGDHRILIIHGKPFHKTLARIPEQGSFKGNLAAGGTGVAKDITDFQKTIGKEIGSILIKNGISFAGIDIIGEYLTEINITSPTCAREILDQTRTNPIEEYFKGL